MQGDRHGFHFSRRFTIGVFGVWAVFTFVVIVVTWVGMWVKTGVWNFQNQIIWESGWFGWSWMSLLVLAIARRFPLDRHRLAASGARLALIGLPMVAAQLAFDFVVITALGMTLQNYDFRWANYLFVAAYKGHAYYAVYWMIVGVAHAIDYHRRFRESELIASQLATKLATAELDRLKSQLQPHFLFNTHHAIVSLILKRENDSAIRMLTRLSDLLRRSISLSGQQFVAVHEELETLQLYLEIQRERFHDRLTIEVDASEEMQSAEIPHLLLQPLVENALHHGLEDITEKGRLEIIVGRDGDRLVCTVRDNGAGLVAESGNVAQMDSVSGIGLKNTRERLQQLYGANQSLTIRGAPGAGCAVTVSFPYRARATSGKPALASV